MILFCQIAVLFRFPRSLRDLHGEIGASLCETMSAELKKSAWEVYGVPANKLRIFFHYHVRA